MDFETIRENLARDIKETLEARSGSDFEVEHRTAEKMNGNYEASINLQVVSVQVVMREVASAQPL